MQYIIVYINIIVYKLSLLRKLYSLFLLTSVCGQGTYKIQFRRWAWHPFVSKSVAVISLWNRLGLFVDSSGVYTGHLLHKGHNSIFIKMIPWKTTPKTGPGTPKFWLSHFAYLFFPFGHYGLTYRNHPLRNSTLYQTLLPNDVSINYNNLLIQYGKVISWIISAKLLRYGQDEYYWIWRIPPW